MTAVMQAPAVAQEADLDARRKKAFAEMLREQVQFDATRPPCPKDWCDGQCETLGHVGTAILHQSDITTVPAEADHIGHVGEIWLRAQRHDSLVEPSEGLVEIDLTEAGSILDEQAHFTAAQARQFAAELLRHADMVEPEYELPAEQVRVGDFLPVGREWLYVYGVMVDEPSNNVQIFTTVDRDTWPELDGDEDPHMFEPGDLVRIRRGGAR